MKIQRLVKLKFYPKNNIFTYILFERVKMNIVDKKVKRSKGLYIKVNDHELKVIIRNAKEKGLDVSKYVRSKAMGKRVVSK